MLISIVIPSRERAEYLKYSLQTVLAISDQKLEILVSDNASEDNTKELVNSFSDKRLRYINTGARISMRANFELALKESKGDYVIFFGDDDGILPGQFSALRQILEEYKPDGVTWNPLSYGWPTKEYNRKSGGIRFERNMLFGAVCISSPQECIKTLMTADTDRENILPKLYHGCMSRKYLDKLANSDGVYFCGRSPDIYISFRATQFGGKFLRINHPFSINGFSAASTGGNMNSQGTDQKNINKDFRFLKECQSDIIDDVIPVTKSMSFALGES
jgi:glycosyltransferase involved in cell wall biosynthesis